MTLLKDQIGIFHACLAQAFFGLLVLIALSRSRAWHDASSLRSDLAKRLWPIAVATTIVIYLQLGLGAMMRHQHRDLSITDFPTAYSQWIPDTSADALAKINSMRDARGLSEVTAGQIWLQMAHRLGAAIITAGAITFFIVSRREKTSPVRRLSAIWLVGVFTQLALGAWTIWSNKAADIATVHVAVGATMLGLGVVICAFLLRRQVRFPSYIHGSADPVTV